MKSSTRTRVALTLILSMFIVTSPSISAHAAVYTYYNANLVVDVWASTTYGRKTGGKTLAPYCYGCLAWIRATAYGTASAYDDVEIIHPAVVSYTQCKWNADPWPVYPGTSEYMTCRYYM